MAATYFWQEHEKQFIRDHWQTMTDAQIGAVLGRGETAVEKMRWALDVGSKVAPEWTKAEKEYLECNWSVMKDKDIAAALGKTVGAVRNHRFQMGLTGKRMGRDKMQRPKGWFSSPYIHTLKSGCYWYVTVEGERRRLLHRIRWMREVGPIPEGRHLRCKTNDTLDTRPSNWYIYEGREPNGVDLKEHERWMSTKSERVFRESKQRQQRNRKINKHGKENQNH